MTDLSTNVSPSRTTHIISLDGVRGVAVLLVVMLHSHILKGGYVGLDIFFVLSGFLITSILRSEIKRKDSIDFRKFYKRRIRRLLPALMICVSFTYLVLIIMGSDFRDLKQPLLAVTYLSDFYFGIDTYYLGHTWSLALEAQFYVLWPAILMFLSRQTTIKRSALLLFCFISAVLCWRGFLASYYQTAAIDHTYKSLDTRSDALIFGAVTSLVREQGYRFRNNFLLFISIALILLVSYAVRSNNLWMNGVGFTLTAASSSYVVGFIATDNKNIVSDVLSLPLLVYIGTISYGLYLYHYPIIKIFEREHLPLPLAILVSFIAAALSWHFIEKPIIRRARQGLIEPENQSA